MAKKIAVILLSLFIVFSFAACKGNKDNVENASNTSSTNEFDEPEIITDFSTVAGSTEKNSTKNDEE